MTVEGSQQIIDTLKKSYLDEIKYIMGDLNTDYSRFSWAESRHIAIYLIRAYRKSMSKNIATSVMFAHSNDQDTFTFIDLEAQTHNFEFEQLYSTKQFLQYFVNKNLVEKSIISKTIPSFLSFTVLLRNSPLVSQLEDLSKWSKEFVDHEYNYFQTELIKNNKIESFPLTQTQLFVDNYHFDEMLTSINDNQFTDEFNQCLFAYQNQKWFLCAAALGSCLEHLMLLTLTSYHKEGQLGRNPTAKDYLKAFTREPISLDSRQQTFIDTLFRLRNSVDHHNSGITSKRICDMLLDGLNVVYNEYFLPSIKGAQ